MRGQQEKASLFHSLHVRGSPLILCNVWDAGSAKAVAAAGARALASSSWAVAAANGYADGEHVPAHLVFSNAARIVQATPLPVSIDIESGYGVSAEAVASSVRSLLDAGAVGCNIEDSFPEDKRLRPIEQQVERLRAARNTASAAGIDLFINARTDMFFATPAERHSRTLVAGALERARAYAAAGANGLFAPGLEDLNLIWELCEGSPLPVNIMLGDINASVAQLASNKVARVSFGPAPYLFVMQTVADRARAMFHLPT